MNIFTTITQAFTQGGIWMWVILVVQIFTMAIILERIFVLYVLRRPNQKKQARRFERSIKTGNLEQTISDAEHMSSMSPISTIAKIGAQSASSMGGRDEIQFKIDEVLLEEQSRVENRIGFLAMLGNVATLVGLLGTIVGLIQAFTSVGTVDPVEKAAILSQGISLAMNTTAYGLIVAVPALVMYSILQNRANSLVDDLNKGALKLFIWLGFSVDHVPKIRKVQ